MVDFVLFLHFSENSARNASRGQIIRKFNLYGFDFCQEMCAQTKKNKKKVGNCKKTM